MATRPRPPPPLPPLPRYRTNDRTIERSYDRGFHDVDRNFDRDWREPRYQSPARRTNYTEPRFLDSIEFNEPIIEINKNDIDAVIANWTGIPMTALQEEDLPKLLRIEKVLHQRIISQEPAISALARAVRRSRAGLKNPNRPVGSFLFLGPTGVGKTEVARTLANYLFGSDRAMIRLDMSEFMEKHSVAKLIGSPPGYIGHDEGGQLTERIRRSPYSVLLLDEVEKAHPDVFNILLQVFEDGMLTDALGHTVDFKNVIIIMTSNIGARYIFKRGAVGFQNENSPEKTEERVMSAVRETFNPEFINRLDEIITFEPLNDDDLYRILDLLLTQTNQLLETRHLEIILLPEAKRWLVEKACKDRSYGARPLRRALQKHVEDLISEAIIQGRLGAAKMVEVYADGDQLECRPLGDHEPVLESNGVLVG